MNNPMMILCMVSDLEKQMAFRFNFFIKVRSVRFFRSKDWKFSKSISGKRSSDTAVCRS
jgi:hypothetical protein